MKTAILYINMSDSRCGACNENCDPREAFHDSTLGYYALSQSKKNNTPYPAPGCHAKYVGVASDYFGIKETVVELRPDLPWVGDDRPPQPFEIPYHDDLRDGWKKEK